MPNLFDYHYVLKGIPEIIKYLPITLEIVIISAFFALILGFILALIKINNIPILKPLVNIYISYMRGTPQLVQLYIAYYGIPILLQYTNYYFDKDYSINHIPSIIFVIVAFSFNEAAYASETIRAAIQSVDKGQVEAALSIGMSYPQTFFNIILPESLIVAIPSLGNIFIGLLKGTSLAFVCAVMEMTAASQLIASRNLRHFEMYIALSIIYWGLTIIFSRIFIYMEKRLKKSERGIAETNEKESIDFQ
ncbi:amino acid ABC transporter permease [Rummeliibacillus sp. SL167]|uniref:amino acid ABC transporter permease n=1 Tax=Rummeliibacillus sp. SL167 TaxID=2579792 RepID=UPI0011B44A44|nr:amino acid ABC transporter permease [Rummeliibacillus sp. SL167]